MPLIRKGKASTRLWLMLLRMNSQCNFGGGFAVVHPALRFDGTG